MSEEKDFYTNEELWEMLFLREGESLDACIDRLIHTACERSRRIIRHLPAGENPNPYKWNLKCFTKEMMRWRFRALTLKADVTVSRPLWRAVASVRIISPILSIALIIGSGSNIESTE